MSPIQQGYAGQPWIAEPIHVPNMQVGVDQGELRHGKSDLRLEVNGVGEASPVD
jgi:hypothetical protein